MTKKFLSILLALSLALTFTVSAAAATADDASSVGVTAEQSAVLTFSDSGITETSAGSGYTIDGTTLTRQALTASAVPAPRARLLSAKG